MMLDLLTIIAWYCAIGGALLAYWRMVSDLLTAPIMANNRNRNFNIIKPAIVSLLGLMWIWWH